MITYAGQIMEAISLACRGTFKLWDVHYTAGGVEATVFHDSYDQQLYRITIVPKHRHAYDTVQVIEENDIPAKLAEAVDIQTTEARESPARPARCTQDSGGANRQVPPGLLRSA